MRIQMCPSLRDSRVKINQFLRMTDASPVVLEELIKFPLTAERLSGRTNHALSAEDAQIHASAGSARPVDSAFVGGKPYSGSWTRRAPRHSRRTDY
jgi:hypothetical protein